MISRNSKIYQRSSGLPLEVHWSVCIIKFPGILCAPFLAFHFWLECSPMAREIWAQSQIESYQRPKKWYLTISCLTLSIIRYVSRVKWSNPGKGVAPSPTPRCSSYRKGSFRVNLDYGRIYHLIVWLNYHYLTLSEFFKPKNFIR